MAKDSDTLADAFDTKETGGLFSGLLAEESAFDRRMAWRLGSWGVAAVAAVVAAVMANQAHLGWRRDQVASADLARQADRLQVLTKESQNEARRLAAAIETLNSDRDRLYSRVTVLEQGLDSVTGAIAKQAAAPPQAATAAKPQDAALLPAPSVAPVASTPIPASEKPRIEANAPKDVQKDAPKEALKEPSSPPSQTAAAASLVQQQSAMNSALPTIPLVPSKSIMAPPDPAASKLVQPEPAEKIAERPADKAAEKKSEPVAAPTEVAAAATKPPEAAETESPAIAVQQTRFALDLGGANSIDGLRALWRGVTKSNPEVGALRPIIMIKEGATGLGMQLRLGAGPLINAAAAAKLCAGLTVNERHCETTVFDGQRLSMRGGPEKPEKSQDRVQDKNAEKNQDAIPQAETAPAPSAKPDKRRRSYSSKRSSKREEPAPAPVAPPPAPAKPEASASTGSALSSFFRR
ncbi:hypothetical protein LPJ38_25075 [Bradyrhizobium daqingense]|uniref:Sporulation related protein n=1 Tax=Bradyrhizobium daqingense TaxID=993502 RepID=A0A562LCM9_9BRAD|nr:hypothetical protein [Bradyrhizobium daqingense]TWI05316.1 hypothetical protein IQ17_03485 [Bradyrhizobium daqingense]UFS86919.1 hypothetical protein LPJ38_25075 [Bradyrhizobium daqingense]